MPGAGDRADLMGGGWKSLGSQAPCCTSQVPSEGAGKWPYLSGRWKLPAEMQGRLRKSFGDQDHARKTNSMTKDGDSCQSALSVLQPPASLWVVGRRSLTPLERLRVILIPSATGRPRGSGLRMLPWAYQAVS